ncbi:PblB [Streptococcus pneumoniae]|uniref:phage tail spike protein n=1 Tax=Streptococcus pneumoniae TaxID=1313 RepID=UPI00061B8E1E|nr:phage tail spike protein [Streptococcus pneumoniae]COB82461.1 PblB [Streptococcus pneumoniae]
MIYLTEGNTPLNEAYNDEIVHLGNNTYQLTFRFPTSDPKWELLKEETFLTADDLHGEQDFYIFEVEKQQGYIQVYANQVISLLNNYIVSSIEVDRVSGTRVLSAFAGSITRANPFSFFSDIDDRHTLNIKDKNAMEVLAKGKHSILGQWGGDMVRNGYNLRLLKNGGSENESLFMYKKNLSSYQHKTSTKSLKTRITFKTTVKGEGENAVDHDYMVVIDSPLLGNYSQIYEDVVEVNDQDVTDEASLIEYGKQYFRTSMCDMLEDNLEISVVGQSDVAVQMFDVVSFYHEWYGLDVRKKITKYTYSPMAKLLKSIGFGTFQSSLANAIGGIVNDAVLNESRNLHQIFEERLKKEIANADRAFDAEFSKREKTITDAIELAKAKAEEVKQELSDTINQRFNSFDNGPLKEAKRKAEEALRNAGASSSLAQESKRIGLDSVARLEAFKSQTTSAQTALSGDLDALKRTIANDIRPKQAQAEAEIAKQVEALSRTKNELAGVKSAQATYEETTTRRLSELTNLANGKASKSELTQTAEELTSRIASVQVGGRNYIRGTKRMMLARGLWASGTFRPSGAGTAKTIDVSDSPATGFDKAIRLTSSNARDQIGIAQDGFYISQGTYTMSCWAKGRRGQKVKLQTYWQVNDNSGISPIFTLKDENWTKLSFTSARNRAGVASIGYVYLVNAEVGEYLDVLAPQLEDGSLATSSKEAPEDIEGQISTVESTFKQRADSLAAGVNRLTEGLRTKADISSLNVTAENIRQSVKSLETDTQNKLNQKLSQAEFEVRAGSIRQEILNATKNKASKSELTQTAEELASRIASVQASGRNLFLNSLFKQDIPKTGIWTTSTYTATIDSESKYLGHKALKIIGLNPSGRDGGNPKVTYPALGQFGKVIPGSTTNQDVTISFYAKANKNGIMLRSRLGNIGYKTGNVTLSTEIKRYVVHIPKGWTNESKQTTNEWLFNFNQEGTVWIWMPKFEISDVDTSYSEAPEDIEGQISTVESTFKQRANSLEAGVNRLTEGLRTKVDISALNVTVENIRQSVKSLETDTQNKLNQKLSQAEFEVRAGSIRQEILNATKDKADKTLVVSEAGKLREEFSKMKVGGRNLWIKSKTVGAVIEKLPENHVTGQKECYRLENNSTLTFNLEPDFSSRLYQKVTFSAWIKYENVVQGRNFWNVFNCFKHYLFRKNSETGVQSGPDYATLGMYKGSADWKYITFTYDYSEKTNFDQLKTSLRFNLEGATSGTAWVTGIKVEIGSVATDWSPAPEDADGLITEAKATFERTAQGLRTDLSAIQEYVNKDGQRQEALQRYTREESTRQATAVRELVNRDFVGKATYQEDVKGINQRIEAVKTSANKDIASQIASYRQSVDGKFTDISSQITTYKQDVGGQISGLSNRLTSSEQGTTTQISNISNRINSNKQGTDNQISNLKTQVATNKDNAERQMGRISDQVSANKANADSQFANVTNQLARKVETTDFQRVKETSKLYERILGNTENGIADKVARMALTNQLFQVEVAKNASNGQNLLKGTKDFSGGWKNKGANWKKHAEKYKGVDVLFKNNSWNGVGQEIDAKIGEVYTFSLWMKSDWKNDTVNFYVNRNGSVEKGWGVPSETSVAITSEWKRYSFTFKITVDGFIFPRVERLNQNTNLYIAGLKLEKGSYATPYTEAPEDTDEAIRSVQSQLTGSWAVQNINSAGDIISGINLGANGHNRFVGKLTHITGETLIDRAVIKSAMVDKLKTGNFEAGSVTTTILDAEAVTADKVRFDAAFIRKMTASDAFIDQLTSKRIFSTKVESVISSSTFLEAYQGRIGGFTIGRFAQGRGRWISGINQFSVGMGNGEGGSYNGENTAFWANWGHSWNSPGPNAWYVTTSGNMYCRNGADFHGKVDFSNSSRANFYGNTTFSRSPVFSNGIELGSKDVLGDGWNPKGGRNAVVWWNQVGSGSVKYWMEQKSDRRLKENITDTAVKALDKINRLRMVAFDFIENKKHEEIGLIAQEAETIVPRIVSRDPENPDGYLHIDYTALVPYLIKAIQELNQKIEKMEKTIA